MHDTDTQTAEVVEISLEKKIEVELVKHNVTDAVINQLKEKYGGLKLRSLDDKETYLEIKAAAREVAKWRTLAVKICKEGREELVRGQKTWVLKEKEVVGKLSEVENPLDAEMKKYDDEVERIKNEEKQRQEDAYMQRVQALTRMGAVYSNNSYTLGDFSMDANLVKETSQDIWEEKMLPSFTAEYEKIEAERIEQKRIEDEKKAETLRLQKQLEEQQAELKRQQEEFEKQKREQERIAHEKKMAEDKSRAELNTKRLQKIQPYNPYNKGVDTQNLWSLDEDAFIAVVDDVKSKYEAEQAEVKRQMEEQIAKKERERLEAERQQAELERIQKEQRKAEELAKSGDKTQWEHFIAEVKKLTVPTARSGQYRTKASIAKEKLEEIINL